MSTPILSRSRQALASCTVLLAATGSLWAQEPAPLPTPQPPQHTLLEALKEGTVSINLRYRFENVDQDGIAKQAHASTLRTALGYRTLPFHGFQALIEFEDVRPIGEENYNDTINGSPRPVVADPQGTEVNQAYLDYLFDGGTVTRLGRQRIVLDNQRFIGDVAWRQNYQTFDAVSLTHGLSESGEVFVAYLDNVNRIFGENSPMGDARMGSVLLNASWKFGLGKLTGYWYELDYDDNVTLSTSTLGLRLVGTHDASEDLGLLYTLEAATQDDTGDNPNNVDAEYYLAELGGGMRGVTVKLGFESLSGSSNTGDMFTTPLALLHAHNGWADKFLMTPQGGLEDTFLSVKAKVVGATCQAVYHNFEAETGGGDYGSEFDLAVTRPINENVSWGLKYANYMEDGLFTDTEKFWAWLSVNI